MLAQQFVVVEVALDELAHVLARLLLRPSRSAPQMQKSAISIVRRRGGRGYLRCSSRLRSIAGSRIGHGRSENITMCAPSLAAASTESSLDATA